MGLHDEEGGPPPAPARAVARRSVLRAGGLLGLGAVLAACSDGATPAAAPGRTTPPPTASAPTTTAPTTTAPPSRSATDLLAAPGTCTLTPATIAGDTWFDAHLVRSDIREDRQGMPLELAFRVEKSGACTPLPGAVVDIWHCDAAGIYSGFAGVAPGDGGSMDGTDEYGDPQARPTSPQRFLRGTQAADADGIVRFTTIYPGWYPTRTVHVHLKVHLGMHTVLTTQLFFDDAVSDAVFRTAPYDQRPRRDTRNGRDKFYKSAAQLTLAQDGDRWLGAIVLGTP